MTVEEREMGALDLLLVIAENIRLLVLGPVLIGVLAWGLAHFLPSTYSSQAILVLPPPPAVPSMILTQPMQTPAQAASLMVSPLVLDPVIELLHLSEGDSIKVARDSLAQQVKPVVGKEGLLTLDVRADSPVLAQAICAAVVDVWLKTTVPGQQDRAYLEQRLTFAKTALDSVTALIDRLGTDGEARLGKPLTRGEAGNSLVGLAELQERYLNNVLTIPNDMQGYPRDVVKQAPTASVETSRPTKLVFAIMSAATVGVLLLLWLLLRHAWARSARDAALAEKQSRIVLAMRFWRR
jgi:hypothetical protein